MCLFSTNLLIWLSNNVVSNSNPLYFQDKISLLISSSDFISFSIPEILFLITFSQLSANPQKNYQSFNDGQSFIKNQSKIGVNKIYVKKFVRIVKGASRQAINNPYPKDKLRSFFISSEIYSNKKE